MTRRPVLERSRPRVSVLEFSVEELVGFLRERLEGRGVVGAYLFGSVAAGTANAWSDLDVVVVQPTVEPFVERPRPFSDLQDLGVPVDVLVYTPEEFTAASRGRRGVLEGLRGAPPQGAVGPDSPIPQGAGMPGRPPSAGPGAIGESGLRMAPWRTCGTAAPGLSGDYQPPPRRATNSPGRRTDGP